MSKSSNLRILHKRKVRCTSTKLEKELTSEQFLKQELKKSQTEHLLRCFEHEEKLRQNPNLSQSTIHVLMALINGIH